MVKITRIGVLSIQGAVSEHIAIMNRALREEGLQGDTTFVRRSLDIERIDALILPGGESTTISRILVRTGMHEAIKKRIVRNDFPIMGTCAGCVLLAKELTDNPGDVQLLKAMDMRVERNAFGRQKQSCERSLDIKGFDAPFNAVFIRAPIITKVWGSCEVLATLEKEIVMARQGHYLALSFHPELTSDLRVHRMFLRMLP
ncbi:MAG TPA: pyridoxal 5'-phosphate synthase glutaminase subunit PdxT [Candidatus Thermoplasmatota archaeon]|nr:pyridoxal 5'-phosphate synthase glutaminase subunit PdxT [Candidatus Thermoplasmatota archaeon]